MIPHALLLVSLAVAGLLPQANGRIRGNVVNTSQAQPSPCQATVLLRVLLEGRFVPFRETASDAEGRFQFDSLPVGNRYRYLVGANRHGVHYPGPRVQLTEDRPNATVRLSVCDAVTHPNPLVIRKLEITICPQPGTLKVTESMLVENPSSTCYVGQCPLPAPIRSRCNWLFLRISSARRSTRSFSDGGSPWSRESLSPAFPGRRAGGN